MTIGVKTHLTNVRLQYMFNLGDSQLNLIRMHAYCSVVIPKEMYLKFSLILFYNKN
jgi:hypothetical protein